MKPTNVQKLTINIPVPDAAEALAQLAALVECEVLVEDGSRYALVTVAGVRIAFVSGSEDLTEGRVALAAQVTDAEVLGQAARAAGMSPRVADHPSPIRFNVTGLSGAADLLYYHKP